MPDILTERRGAAFIVTFNRPDHANALGFEMATHLFNILKPVTTDRSIRAVLLQGAGANFMDSMDMELYSGDVNASLERTNQMFQPYHSAIREFTSMEKPVLAACTGMTAGVGMSFMLACDLVIAAKSAVFNCKFCNYGMTPHGGLSHSLARKAGAAKATELLMMSEDFSAAEAERLHLINRVVDDENLKDEARAWLDRLANGPTRAYGGSKMLIAKAFEQNLSTQLSLEHTYWGASVRGFDFREAVKAHFAKRPAKFTGA